MTDVHRLPDHVAALFKPREPLKYVEPCDHDPAVRGTKKIEGVADFIKLLQEPDDSYVPTESWLQKQQRAKQEKQQNNQQFLDERRKQWDPKKDLHVRGDPYKTLFIGRLAYSVTEQVLQRELERFGPIERVRVVTDQNGKSRGYAFVVFERTRDMETARREMRDKPIQGRKVVTDSERGRTDGKFLPRSLGGGLGGRHYTNERRDRFGARPMDRDRPRGPRRGGFDRFERGDKAPRFRDRPSDKDRGREHGRDRDNRGPPREYRERDRERDKWERERIERERGRRERTNESRPPREPRGRREYSPKRR